MIPNQIKPRYYDVLYRGSGSKKIIYISGEKVRLVMKKWLFIYVYQFRVHGRDFNAL